MHQLRDIKITSLVCPEPVKKTYTGQHDRRVCPSEGWAITFIYVAM